LKKLFAHWGEEIPFVEVFIRQAHPGPGVPPYRSFEQKFEDARRYVQEEGIPWTVLVDDLEGRVHQSYGGLADPSYLIGGDGRVSFYNMWTHAPTLNEAIVALRHQGGQGVVQGGIDHVMHLAASMTDGWKGIRRGLPQSYVDLETAAPGMGSGTWLGYQMRPALAPLTLRSEPLPAPVKLALAAGAGFLLGRVARRALR
jgi:hypothetical protein